MADSFWDEKYEQPVIVEQAETREQLILKKILSYWYVPLGVLILMLISSTISLLVTMAILVGLAVGVSLYRLAFPFNLGLELVSLFSIALSFAVNPLAGAIVAAAATIISHSIYNNFCTFMFIKLAVFSALCFLVPLFGADGVVVAGVVLVILRNVIFAIMTFFMNPQRLGPDAPGMLINILVNAWLFARAGEWLVGVLGGA